MVNVIGKESVLGAAMIQALGEALRLSKVWSNGALPSVQARIERAMSLVASVRAGEGCFLVPSSDGTTEYTVTVAPSCDCADYRIGGGRACKHVWAARLACKAGLVAMPAATTVPAWVFAGNSTVTVSRGDVRFTYKIRLSDDGKRFFVLVLSGPDNTRNYTYIGFIPDDDRSVIVAGAKGRPDAPSFKFLGSALRIGFAGHELHHEGKCGKCGRKLTTPESLETGLGPVCKTK